MLEKAVRDRAQAIVRTRERLPHGVFRARIVEAGQQDQRAVADVAVAVFGDGLDERGHRLGGRRTPNGARGGGAGRIVEIAKLVDRGFELRGGDRLRCARFLRGSTTLEIEDTKKTKDTQEHTHYFATASLSSFKASCR